MESMLFWIAALALTAAASLAVLLPFVRGTSERPRDSAYDLEVYKDQLGEVEREHAAGLIGAEEAAQAKAEIGRAILKRNSDARARAASSARYVRLAGLAAVLAVPVVSWGLYAALGSPELPDQPLSARMSRDPAQSSVEELVARAEMHLRENPADVRGWEVLAPIYMRLGRFDEARDAWRNAVRLAGESAPRQNGLGEAIAAAADGTVTAEAAEAFRGALALAPDDPKARYYLALALAQEGRMQEAAEAWHDLGRSLPADSPWRQVAEGAAAQAQAEQAAGSSGSAPAGDVAASGDRGPSAEDMAAADEMSAEDRSQMIEQMVAGLDERLRQEPADAEGWRRLIRAYVVLGRPDDAKAALARAKAGLADDPQALRGITEFAAGLGVEGGSSTP